MRRRQAEPDGSFDHARHTQIPSQIFVQIMLRINLLLSAFRANMYLPKGKTEKAEETAMTRFQKELSGELGAYWEKEAQKELERVKADCRPARLPLMKTGLPATASAGC